MPDQTPPSLRFRSVFVSDVHLGSAGCMVEEFTQFLNGVQCQYLYLVGDIVDLWVVMKEGKWRQAHTEALQSILAKTREGVKVFYTPGNHDAFLRRLNGSEFGNIALGHSFEHVTADGKRLNVIHGDLFDNSVRFVPVAWLAAWAYEGLTVFNNKWNARRTSRGKKSIEFSSVFKKRLKRFIGRRTDFAENLLEDARFHGFDGVVCGHIHKPQITDTVGEGLYVNTGDWVEHGTVVVEHLDGRLELLRWEEIRPRLSALEGGAGGHPASILMALEHGAQGCGPTSSKHWV
ncbi:MAG: metallophosphoesterase family protein [Armatimonadetes bacterium]|nr:metallophosphoesterase family protein [Armatimonadota bacterium]